MVNGAEAVGQATGRPQRLTGAAIFVAAFALYMTVAVLFPGIHYPDEVMQSLEQAHRAVFGYGLVPWEFRDGARSWLLPGLLMAPMWLGDALAPGTEAYRLLAQALVAAVSASTPVVGYWWGMRFGRWHGVLAALVLGTWFEAVHFGTRALGEVVGSAFLFAGVFLCSGRRDSGRAVLAGLCLGTAFVFRFHLAPAIALAAAWRCRLDLRRAWLPMLAGAGLPLLALGLVDALAWGAPFSSILANIRVNVVEGRSLLYGTAPAGWYALQFVERWGAATGAIAILAVWGARRDPLPLLVALVIVLTHSAIAHKEYRFVYPAIPLVLLSAALGSAEFCSWLAGFLKRPAVHAGLVGGACLAWMAASYSLATAPQMRPEWFRGRAGLELMSRARTEADCGVGLLVGWSWTGGYSSLHKDIPIHLQGWDRRTWQVQAFDAWIAPRGFDEPAAMGYRRVQCAVQGTAGVDELCLWTRTGGCDQTGATTEAQRVLDATGH